MFLDFEKAAINTFREVWPLTYVKGCFFYLSQAVYRKIQEVGLQTRYLNDLEFSLLLKMLPALAYLPPQHVVHTFEILKTQISHEALPLYDYFENTYVGRRDEFGSYDSPLFPIEMWNNFHLVRYGIPRTTNSFEAWHRAFSVTVACHHPIFWKFCHALTIEQASIKLRQVQYYKGILPTKSEKSLEN